MSRSGPRPGWHRAASASRRCVQPRMATKVSGCVTTMDAAKDLRPQPRPPDHDASRPIYLPASSHRNDPAPEPSASDLCMSFFGIFCELVFRLLDEAISVSSCDVTL